VDKIELSKHVRQGDTFYTPFTDPSGLGATLSLSSWAKCWLPEFLWIGLIIQKLGRKKGLENLYLIIEDLKREDLAFPQLSKILTIRGTAEKILVNSNTVCRKKNIVAFDSSNHSGYKCAFL